jgi:hypothetical protein
MGSKSAIGIGNGICFKQVRDKGGGSYIDPLVCDSIVGLWKFDQNTNESPTRNIIKNTIKDKGGDLELLNFAYKANSGYNGYPEDFTSWRNSNHIQVEYSTDGRKFKITSENIKDWWLIAPNNGISKSFKVKITNCNFPIVWRYTDDGNTYKDITISEDGIYNLPQSIINNEGVVNRCYFGSGTQISDYTGLTIEQLPLYEGALVTDGKDDMIVSQKTVQEMSITDKITVVSMIHQIGIRSEYNRAFNNYICNQNVGFIRNNIAEVGIGKTGIYGYTWNNSTKSVINNILGDKDDYSIEVGNSVSIEGKFTVEGYIKNDSPDEISGVAVYWTFIANKVLTTDEINQIIGYYKLDKYVTPQVIYDVKRQGLTNDTPDSDWYLKDFSKNGFDMSLFNFAKKLDSGIGKYEVDYSTWTKTTGVISTPFGLKITEPTHNYWILYTSNITVPAHKVEISGIPEGGEFRYLEVHILKNGINELPKMKEHPSAIGFTLHKGTTQPSDWVGLSVEQIPDYEGALVSNGIDDYGKVENLPIYKDYTVVAEYSRIRLDSCILSKSKISSVGSFIFNMGNTSYSYTASTDGLAPNDASMQVKYQSKYINQGRNINAGTQPDSDSMWLGVVRDNDTRFSSLAVRSILVYPYSLSPLLIERQLKRYKLGTLYPDMVEFRPVISGNIPYNAIEISQDPTTLYNKSINETGIYLQEGSTVRVYIQPSGIDEVSKITINGVEYTDLPINPNGYYYADFPITKSPQKISYAIDEYIRYEDIVQPYPAIINLKQDGKTITWGDKLKVGSEVTFVNHINLLPEIYTTSGGVSYNGTIISGWNTPIVVAKSMVFTNVHNWELNTTEPYAIYSQQKLNIPNSSLKILGYVPDLTGKGNHGKLNNFAYALNSGANGYKYDWNTWKISKSGITSTITDNSIHITRIESSLNEALAFFENTTTTNKKFNIKLKISGLTSDMKCTLNNQNSIIKELVNGVNEISVDLVAGWYGFMIIKLDGSIIGDCDITIEQIGEHEGSICFDGTDDHITIPTLAYGGKCMLMKVNWNKDGLMLYDQRRDNNPNSFAIYIPNFKNEDSIAYSSRNDGKTYIDGVLNTSVKGSQLKDVTHNITITNSNSNNNNTVSPTIGSNAKHNAFYAQMVLYEFMLLPDVPDEEEIKELNDVMGIEGGYVESPNYYYDAYGKKNTDTDRNAKEPV